MRYPKPIVEIVGDIVGTVGSKLIPQLKATNGDIQSLNYLYGHPLELIQRLKDKMKNPGQDDGNGNMIGGKFDVYPLIMLFTDIPESYPGDKSGYYADVNLQMVIAYCTSRDLTAPERLEKNFKPILLPIYEELMKQITRSGSFVVYSQKQIKHTKYDRYYWGRSGLYGNEGNMFNDFIDAIEIKDLQLRVNNQKSI